MGGRPSREPLHPADDPARHWRPDPRRRGPDERLRLLLPPNVIKPALVGLLGPWISGGVEFNWPQHHRPSTFMPVDWEIEERPDGSVTVWCSEYEPMQRMKGMHGVTLYPDSSIVEVRVRLFNRTPFVQTFLWWANVAARVHDRYQSFFPPDVTYVADHAKRASPRSRCRAATTTASTRRAPPDEADLAWYGNIPSRPRTWRWGPRRTSSAATTTRPRRASSTGPTTASRRARSNGRGATTSSATPGIAS